MLNCTVRRNQDFGFLIFLPFMLFTSIICLYFAVLPKKDRADMSRKDTGALPMELLTNHTQMRYVDHSFDNIRRVKRYQHFQHLQYDQRWATISISFTLSLSLSLSLSISLSLFFSFSLSLSLSLSLFLSLSLLLLLRFVTSG